jgi:hypothetical protein
VLTVATSEGFILRFHHGDVLHSDAESRSGSPLRLSHVNLNCITVEPTSLFFRQVLGFQLTDRSKAMAFLRCNSDSRIQTDTNISLSSSAPLKTVLVKAGAQIQDFVNSMRFGKLFRIVAPKGICG